MSGDERTLIADAIVWTPAEFPKSYEVVYAMNFTSHRDGQPLRIEIPMPQGEYEVEVHVTRKESA